MTDFQITVQARQLRNMLREGSCKIIDASWHLPAAGRDARAEYQAGHIPGAAFFDLDDISDKTSDLPHMLPSASDFASAVSRLGISNDDQVIVYDDSAVKSSARLWWMFRAFGHTRVAVLDGGLSAWKAAGGHLETGERAVMAGDFLARLDEKYFCDWQAVDAATRYEGIQILDARAASRFDGSTPEPRPGLRSGHIPGALNLPFDRLFDSAGLLKSETDLHKQFTDAGLDMARPVITSCGSGITACVLALGMEMVGKSGVTVYDGSWVEWGGREDLRIETGEPR